MAKDLFPHGDKIFTYFMSINSPHRHIVVRIFCTKQTSDLWFHICGINESPDDLGHSILRSWHSYIILCVLNCLLLLDTNRKIRWQSDDVSLLHEDPAQSPRQHLHLPFTHASQFITQFPADCPRACTAATTTS